MKKSFTVIRNKKKMLSCACHIYLNKDLEGEVVLIQDGRDFQGCGLE